MTRQSHLQRRQERKPLFAQGRQIATNPAKGAGTRQAAEAPGDLLLHFEHAQIALGQIVVKVHPQILQEAEDRLLVCAHAVEQIAGGTLFDASLGARRGGGSRREAICLIQHAEKGAFPIQHLQRIEPRLALLACVLGGLLHQEQQVDEFGCPHGFLLFGLKDQFAQHMHQAERMLAVVQEVRPPGIMNTDASEPRQDANRVQRLLSAAGMHLIMRETRRTGDMRPEALARHRHARFVLMDDRCLPQGLFELLLDGSLPDTFLTNIR